MTSKNQTILRFELETTANPFEVMKRFRPQGNPVLNKTEWRGKEPRSCAITNVRSRPFSVGTSDPKFFDIEVTYRPKGCITFVGGTKYDGWTASVLDQTTEGTLLDGHGNPLKKGALPVYRSYEVYEDVDFNEIDFGTFIAETDVEGIKHVDYDDMMDRIHKSEKGSISISSPFAVPRRHRPTVKIAISNEPSGTATDGFGTKIVIINSETVNLGQAVLDQLMEFLSGFIEGRYSIKNISTDELVMAELDDILVDFTRLDAKNAPRFNCLKDYLPPELLEELAKRLVATYDVEVSIVEGPKCALVFELTHKSNS